MMGEVEERIDLLFTLLHVLHLNNDNNEQYGVIGLESPFVINFQSVSIVQKEDISNMPCNRDWIDRAIGGCVR